MLKGPNRTPNWMLFNPTEIPENVRTIPNNFKSQGSESDDINITQCPEGPEYCFDRYNPESDAIQLD